MAAKMSRNQSEVWNKVSEYQMKASAKPAVRDAIAASPSPTSLELTLENKQVKNLTGEYVKDLSKIIAGKNDVVGYAFAINGKVNSADVYSSNALFKKLWPKLINASAAEAFADVDATKKFGPVKEDAVKACLADAGKAKPSQTEKIGQARVEMQQTRKNVMFTTSDDRSKQLVHMNCLSK